MKIRLNISDGHYEEVKKKLLDAGFEIGEEGEYILSESGSVDSSFVIARDEEGHKVHIASDDIIYIESFGHDVEVHTTEGRFFASERLYQLAEKLDREQFFRVSNSVIISKKHVRKIRPAISMKFVLTMDDGTIVDVTRSYYYAFKEFFGI